MKTYFIPNNGFVNDKLHSIPENAVLLTDKEYEDLIVGQSKGGTVVTRNGRPVLEYEEIEDHTERDARDLRNHLLKRTDWSQLDDVPQGLKESYKEYRQKLRDITEQKGFPHNIKWPEPPEEL